MTRLIDADELRTIKSIQSGDFNSIESIQKWIDNVPTVETTEKQAILFLINNGWLVNHDKELREKWERPQGEQVDYMTGKEWNLYMRGYKQGKTDFERPKGTWKLIKDKGNNVNAECPFCKFEIKSIAYNYSVWEVIQFIKNNDFDYKFPNFCENCGADMRKGSAK